MMLILVEDRLTVHSYDVSTSRRQINCTFLFSVCMYIYGICQNEILTIVFVKQV
jgi:hypothetical protein